MNQDDDFMNHDQRSVARYLRRAVSEELVTMQKLHTPPKLKWTTIEEDGSAWIIFKVEGAEPYDATLPLPAEFAMWRETRAIYKVIDAKVLDDPILERATMESQPVLTGKLFSR